MTSSRERLTPYLGADEGSAVVGVADGERIVRDVPATTSPA
jgi:hypothetical protein